MEHFTTREQLREKTRALMSIKNVSFMDRCDACNCIYDKLADLAEEAGITTHAYRDTFVDPNGLNEPVISQYYSYVLPDGTKSAETWGNPNAALSFGYLHLIQKI